TFSMCKDLLRQTPQQAEDRDHLRALLERPSGGVIFTTLQKFAPEPGETEYATLTDRRNVVVIADEAHRSHYGFEAKVERKTGDEAQTEQERLKRKWASVEALVGTEKRLGLIADDLVKHFEARVAALDGKGMIVCMSRRICVALYDAIVKLRPEWHSDDDEAGAIKIVMTGAA